MDEEPTHVETHLTPDPVAAAEPPAAGGGGRLRRAARALALDITPLKVSRDFRLLFFGQTVTLFGSMMTYAVLLWQMSQLTGSPLAAGSLALAELVPTLAMAFVGGALADYVDRRRMVRLTELALMAGTGLLIFNSTLAQPRVWVLYLCAALSAALTGLQRPSLEALVPRLLPPELMTAAGALRSVGATVAMLGGMALGGVLVVEVGPVLAYSFDLLTFVVSLAALLMLRAAMPPPAGADRPSLRTIAEGLRYARRRPELLGTYLVDMNAMFFGMPISLFPFIAERLGGGRAYGLLLAAPAAGMFLATLSSGWTRRVHRHGLAVCLAASVWGLAIVGFGLSPSLWAALACLAVAGAADMVSGLFRMTMWNQTIPDHLRGRLAGIEMISYTTGPHLGNFEAGLVAKWFGDRASVVSGGVLCVAGTGVLALLLPAFLRYDGREGLRRKAAEEEARAAALASAGENPAET